MPDQVRNQLSETITVHVDTLDGVLEERGIRLENEIVLKIDVQGFEADAILGISNEIWQQVSILVLEVTPSAFAKLTPEDIDTLFTRLGHFDVFEVFHDAAEQANCAVSVVDLADVRKMSTDPQTEYFNLLGLRK